MAVFCDRTGVRIVAPTGNEKADVEVYRKKTGKLRPLCVEVDPEHGWQPLIHEQPAAQPKPTAAPVVERAPQPAERSAHHDAPRKGNR
jgi:hypothetical protein